MTPERAADEAKGLELELVHDSLPQLKRMGRPAWVDGRRFLKICAWIEQGESISEACRREAVQYRSFRRRVTQVPSFQRRLREAEQVREGFLKEFHIRNVLEHAHRNVLASLWWLERRYPGQFALRNVVRADPNESKELEEEIPAEVLSRHRQLLLELARQDEARQAKELPPPVSLEAANLKQSD